MPLTPAYTWSETSKSIIIEVNVPGLTKKAADIVVTRCCVKVNFQPYLLLLDLHNDIDHHNSSATITPNGICFELQKVSSSLWGHLLSTRSKQELEARRKAALIEHYDHIDATSRRRIEQKKKEEKEAVDRQFEIEKAKRQAIETAKATELDSARKDLVQWQKIVENSDTESETDDEKHVPDHKHYYGTGWKPQSTKTLSTDDTNQQSTPQKEVWDDADSTSSDSESSSACNEQIHEPEMADWEEEDDEKEEEEHKGPPQLRVCQPVPVSFTKLETDHLPARETREEEIKLYKKKNAVGSSEDSMDMSERQPVFLKDKGDAMFKQGNYRGALNAYTRALEMDACLHLVWSNRAACHLKLHQYEGCIHDCSKALDLLNARKDSHNNQAERTPLVKIISRRGKAYAELHRYTEALADYEEALRYDKNSEALQVALAEIRMCMQPADPASLKACGDSRYKAGDCEGAAEAYSVLLKGATVDSSLQATAFSNRSACYLLLGRYEEAVQDCNAAMALSVKSEGPCGTTNILELTEGLDAIRQNSVVRIVSRRGAAYAYMKLYKNAMEDYQAAYQLLLRLGEHERAEDMNKDIQSVLTLQEQQQTQQQTQQQQQPVLHDQC